jgi:cyanophycin synthetase
MRVSEIQTLAGPNICSHRPVLAMKIYLDELTDKESRDLRGFNERLLALLPGLSDHHCALGRPGGFIERLNEGTYFGHVIEHIALELTSLAGVPVTHGKTRQMGEPGCYRIFIEYQAEQGTKFLLRAAVEMIDYLLRGESYPLTEKLDEAKKLIARTELGPSTKVIVEAATRRNIPWRRIGQGSLVQFGYGHRRQFIQAAMTSHSSAIAVEIASDKDLKRCCAKLLCPSPKAQWWRLKKTPSSRCWSCPRPSPSSLGMVIKVKAFRLISPLRPKLSKLFS